MKQNLEDFISNNREEFDSEEMKIDWEKIKTGVTSKRSGLSVIKKYWWAAAAGIMALVSVFMFSNNEKRAGDTVMQTQESPSPDMGVQVDPAYTSQVDQFVRLINLKQNELKQNQKLQPELYSQFLKDNNHLDSSYDYLKSQLPKNPNREVLLEAMIHNLELKIEVLNRQLQIIKQSKNKKTDNENKTI